MQWIVFKNLRVTFP